MEKNNQLINNTGGTYPGIIFNLSSSNMIPSEHYYESVIMNTWPTVTSGPNKVKINPSENGWTEKPDEGGTDLRKDMPIGDLSCLYVFAIIYCVYIAIKNKRNRRRTLSILAILFAMPISANITAFRLSPASGVRAGQELIIQPTIVSVPEGSVQVCWGLFYDAACSHEVANLDFSQSAENGANAVSCTTPLTAGTYYIKSSLQTGTLCSGVLDSYYVTPVEVFPANADIILTREAQGSAQRIDITEESSKKAYVALRFSKARMNDAELSSYERYNYFVSFPFDVQVADIYGIGEVGTHWLLYYYDGKGRAEEGFFAERTDNWVMIDDTDSILHAGQGYLLQLNSIQMAEDNEDVWTNGKDIATLYFPSLSTLSEVVTVNETIPALSEAYQCTIDLSASLGSKGDRRVKDSYWRCIGVPSFGSPSGVSELDYLYEWDPKDNSLSVVSSTGYTFAPTHAYLVQHGGQIVWTDVTRPAAMAAQRKEINVQEWKLELKQGETMYDRTYIRLSNEEDVTAGFDFGHDLSKELNAGKANIYTMVGYERLAANCLPDSTTIVPIGVQIAQNGEYQIVVNEGARIIDRVTNIRSQNYTVYLESGTYEGRFFVETSEAVSTGIQNTGYRTQTSNVQKVMINGRMFIVRDEKMYDLWGRFVQKAKI